MSFPEDRSDVLSELWTPGHSVAAARCAEMCSLSGTFFLVTDKGAGQKKRLQTAATRARDEAMAMPVLLQRVADPAVVDYPMVYHDGYPTLRDLLQVAS